MGEMCAPKASRKTHSEAASSSQLAAAQMPALVSSSELEKRIFMRSATFWTSEVTVSGLHEGEPVGHLRWMKTAACFSPRVRR